MTDHPTTARTAAAGPLAVAIVGCGIIGLNHARAILRHPRLTISALVDAVPEAAELLADRVAAEGSGARPAVFATVTDALAAAPVDVVVICTPSGLHVAVAEEATSSNASASRSSSRPNIARRASSGRPAWM